MQMSVAPVRYGRVIRASLDRFSAECFQRECAPPLGELVAVEDAPAPLYAVVAAVVTEGIDSSRRLNNRGAPDQDLDRVLADHPHVPALLATTFEAIVVGHQAEGALRQYLPPSPAPILARIRLCSAEERETFTRSFDFLRLLLNGGPLADDVIAASLRCASAGSADGRLLRVRGGKALAPLLANDPSRLHAILRRLQ